MVTGSTASSPRRCTFSLPPIASPRSLSAMPRVVIEPAVPDRETLDSEIAHLRGLDVKGSEPDGTRCSGGERPLTCPATCCFEFSPIGSRPISWVTSIRRPVVCSTGLAPRLRSGGWRQIVTGAGPS